MSAAFPAANGPTWPTPAALAAGGIGVRPLDARDHVWLRELYASTRTDELSAVTWPDAAKRAFLDQQFDLQHRHFVTHFAGADYLAIESGARPIGRLYLDRTRDAWLVVDIALLPEWRGAGLGSALLSAVCEDAAAARRDVELHVALNNPRARRLYERHGFASIEQSATHLLMRRRTVPVS